jgi:hypothetical protein
MQAIEDLVTLSMPMHPCDTDRLFVKGLYIVPEDKCDRMTELETRSLTLVLGL